MLRLNWKTVPNVCGISKGFLALHACNWKKGQGWVNVNLLNRDTQIQRWMNCIGLDFAHVAFEINGHDFCSFSLFSHTHSPDEGQSDVTSELDKIMQGELTRVLDNKLVT